MQRWHLLTCLLLVGCADDPVAPPVDGAAGDFAPDQSLTDGALDAAPDGGAPDGPSCVVGEPQDPLTIKTDRGLLRGKQDEGTIAFLGVPYASPPEGQLRWAPPQPHPCWNGVREATQFGDRCPQSLLSYSGDENCLFLNVWTPKLPTTGSQPKPVLFFVHGGANFIGAGNEGLATILGSWAGGAANLYDGRRLAENEDVVVVTMNYRLGPLGFLALHELEQESAQGAAGNYGLLDIIAALEWVQRNIAAVGGDPQRVLLFGESAGAANTCMMMVSPLAKGLFSAALMESGGCDAKTPAEREVEGGKLAQRLGCGTASDRLACLRSKPAKDVTGTLAGAFLDVSSPATTWAFPWGATVDGHVLPAHPMQLLEQGKQHHVPLVVGSNADETELFIPAGTVNTCLDYPIFLKTMFGDDADKVAARYPCLSYPLARWAAVDALTDAIFTCPARRIVRAVAAHKSQPVYRFYFTRSYSHGALALLRSFHTSELMFVFQSFANVGYIATPAEAQLSNAMQSYWSRLAATGAPAGTALPAWPTFDLDKESYLVLDDPVSAGEKLKNDTCDFWDQVYP